MTERVFEPRVYIQRFQNTSPEQVRLGIYHIENDGISKFIDKLKEYDNHYNSNNEKSLTNNNFKKNKSFQIKDKKNEKLIKIRENSEQLRQEAVIEYEKRKTLISKNYGDPYLTVFIAHIPPDAIEEDIISEIRGKIPGLTKCDVSLIQRKSPTNSNIKNNNVEKNKKIAKRHNYAFVTLGNKSECRQLLSMGRHIFIKGKNVIVEVERGRVVKNWLPKRLRKH